MRITLLSICALVCAALPGAMAADSQKPPTEHWWTPAPRAGLELPPAVFGPDADVHWSILSGAAAQEGGPFSLEEDPLAAKQVLVCGAQPLTVESRTNFAEVEIECRVRLGVTAEKPAATFTLVPARDPADPKSPGLPISLTGMFNGGIHLSALGAVATYKLRAYDRILPTWDESVRVPVERDMASLPLCEEKWVHIRYRLAKEHVRIWVDDRLLVDRRDPTLQTGGLVRLALQPGTRLAELRVQAASHDDPAFVPIPLDGYVHDRTLVQGAAVAGEALPFGRTALVEGVPFSFVGRSGKGAPDHLDLGRSTLREANMEGYLESTMHRFAGAFWVDPARIQLRIPNERYDALHVVAAFDGEPNRRPEMTAMFYRPGAGFAQGFEAAVPSATAQHSEDATPLPVVLENGAPANLWLLRIPLDPSLLASFSDMETLEVELTKHLHQYRSYPDPIVYGWHGGGLPSGVHVYALTLHRADVALAVEPTAPGHVWTAPSVPGYTLRVENRAAGQRTVSVVVETRSHDGES